MRNEYECFQEIPCQLAFGLACYPSHVEASHSQGGLVQYVALRSMAYEANKWRAEPEIQVGGRDQVASEVCM